MSVPDRRTGGRALWERDLAREKLAKMNFRRRVAIFVGVLLAWFVVGLGLATFVQLTISTVVIFGTFTMWDAWKMWKGKQSV